MKILIYVVVFLIYSALKPFLDVFLYNMFSATYGPGTDTTALYCGIFAAIFAVSAISCAQWLCKRWEKKQSAKAQHSAHTEAEPEAPTPEELPVPQPEPEPTIADPTTPAPATPKLRFCKLCGSPIDPAVRKCTGCGKQYFRPPVFQKKHLVLTGAVLACVAVVILIFNLTSRLSAADAQIAELNNQIAELEDTVAEQKRKINVYKSNESSYRSQLSKKDDEIKDLNSTCREMLLEIMFYDRHAVIVGDDGTNKYHKYGCAYLDTSDGLWIFNIENAKYQGYKACSYCCD